MIITAAQHSPRHIPPADGANPTHGSVNKESLQEWEKQDQTLHWKMAFPLVPCQNASGIWIARCNAPHFCERVKRNASSRDRMLNLTWSWDIAPAGAPERLHTSLLLGMIQPFISRQLYRLVLACEKRPLLLVSFGTGSSIAAPSGFFWEPDPCNGEIKPLLPFFCKVQTEPRHKQWNEWGAEAWSQEFTWVQASMFNASICQRQEKI